MNNQWWAMGMLLLLGGVTPAETAAQECDEAVTTRAMEQCLTRELEDANRRLRQAAERAEERLPTSSAGDLLRTAQEQWEAYRTTQCRSVYESLEGGSMAGIAYLGCSITLARTRVEELDELYPPFDGGELTKSNGGATEQSKVIRSKNQR